MERLTDCAQGYCEMYCKKYGHCFGDPGDCIFKDEIKLYEAVKSIEGIVPFDRLLELACADKAGRLVVLPCKVGDTVYSLSYSRGAQKHFVAERKVEEILYCSNRGVRPWIICCFGGWRFDNCDIGKTVFLTRDEAEAALAGKGGAK